MSISYFEKNLIIKYIIFGSKCPAVVDMMLGESNNLPLFYKSATFFLQEKCGKKECKKISRISFI